MFFLMMVSAIVPIGLGAAIKTLFGNTKLSKSLFIFMCFISAWQMDVAILFAHSYLTEGAVDMLFRFFRFGVIMLPPSILYVTMVILNDLVEPAKRSKLWMYAINNKTITLITAWGLIVYLVGWTDWGIKQLLFLEIKQTAAFYFPVYGTFSWIFNLSLPLFFISILICLLISRKVSNKHIRSFLLLFVFTSIFAYAVGTLNMFPQSGMFPSSIAVMIFALAVFIGFCLMHSKVVKEMNDNLHHQKELLRTVIDTIPTFIYIKNKEGNITLANHSLVDALGQTIEGVIGKKEREIMHFMGDPEDRAREESQILYSNSQLCITEEHMLDDEGSVRSFQTSKIPITVSDSRQLLCVSTEITERIRNERQIAELAYNDTLTGLPNRLSFNTQLDEALQKKEKNVALMFIDLDRFKMINDTLGHSVGDQFLREVAERLSGNLNGTGKVYRIGGDEFVALIENCSKDQAREIADKIMNGFKPAYFLNVQEFFSTASIGIAVSPEDGEDGQLLMKRADTAMHLAKEAGKNKFLFYEPEMDLLNARKMELEFHLRKAIQNEDFELYYQPQYNLSSGKVVGVEALLRWNHPEFGQISPAEFISIAEETGLIVTLGEWVLREACQLIQRLIQHGFPPIKVAVNISLKQFYESNLAESIEQILKSTGINPKLLELEITESVAMFDADRVIEILLQLRKLGITISMDDFGTGYSSLSYLMKLPIDKLKIDKAFLIDVTTNKNNAAIVSTVIVMAKKIGLDVIAEGVETEEQLIFLRNEQCNVGQGYYFCSPLPEAVLNEFLISHYSIHI